jgi:hypothetical protein
MSTWQPLPQYELFDLIYDGEIHMTSEVLHFWNLIKIRPIKWQEPENGDEGGGFWVVAICGEKVIWYNDIEEGFNISPYHTYGVIDGYTCEQDELQGSVQKLYENRA